MASPENLRGSETGLATHASLILKVGLNHLVNEFGERGDSPLLRPYSYPARGDVTLIRVNADPGIFAP